MSEQEPVALGQAFSRFLQDGAVTQLGAEEAQQLRKFIGWCGSHQPIASIQRYQIETYCQSTFGTRVDPKPFLSAVRTFFGYAQQQGLVREDPTATLRLPAKRVTKKSSPASRPPASQERTFISRKRYEELQAELHDLKTAGRERISRQLHAAIKDGDLRENAAYDEAKYQQGLLEARIRELEHILRTSLITDEQPATTPADVGIQVGMRVELSDGKGTVAFHLVGPSEVDPLQGRISYRSPVGASLIGRRVGDTVTVQTPAGNVVYRVLRYSAE